jgi:integrase
MPTLPAKGLDRFIDTLTWKKAVKDAEREHRARHAKRVNSEDFRPLKPPRQISYLHFMERGLSLMLVISYGGTKSFRALTYRDGRPHYWKLGTYPQMTVKQARAKAQEYFKDPQKIEDAAAVGTFKEVAEEWFKRHVIKEKKLRSAAEIRRQLRRYVYPKWGNKKFLDIRRKTVNELLDQIADNSGAPMADYVLATLRGIMTWYQSRDEDYVSPIVAKMKRDKREAKARARKRILNHNEIRRVWEAAGECGIFGALIKMLLLTAQRREKVVSMRWDDVVDGVWTIRTEEREKGNPLTLVLPQFALDIIAAQPRIAGNPYIFAGSLKGRRRWAQDAPKPSGPPTFNSFSQSKAELDERLGDLPHWTLHDLRRTARSLMAEIGVPEHITERVLGHAIPGIGATYNRYEYGPEKAEALQRLAAKIESIINPPTANVLPLRR